MLLVFWSAVHKWKFPAELFTIQVIAIEVLSFLSRTICAIFLYYWTEYIDGFSLWLQKYVTNGNDAKNQQFLAFILSFLAS